MYLMYERKGITVSYMVQKLKKKSTGTLVKNAVKMTCTLHFRRAKTVGKRSSMVAWASCLRIVFYQLLSSTCNSLKMGQAVI